MVFHCLGFKMRVGLSPQAACPKMDPHLRPYHSLSSAGGELSLWACSTWLFVPPPPVYLLCHSADWIRKYRVSEPVTWSDFYDAGRLNLRQWRILSPSSPNSNQLSAWHMTFELSGVWNKADFFALWRKKSFFKFCLNREGFWNEPIRIVRRPLWCLLLSSDEQFIGGYHSVIQRNLNDFNSFLFAIIW